MSNHHSSRFCRGHQSINQSIASEVSCLSQERGGEGRGKKKKDGEDLQSLKLGQWVEKKIREKKV